MRLTTTKTKMIDYYKTQKFGPQYKINYYFVRKPLTELLLFNFQL